MEYVALDFETANGRIDSICQIGAVTFSDGKVVSEYNQLIRPQPFYFEPINIQIHGIDANMVKQAPTFSSNYQEFYDYIQNKKIICHNAMFDMNVLYKALQRNHLPVPNITYECSLALSRYFVKGEVSYSLGKLVSSVLDFEFKHHDALEDAYACGLLYQYLLEHFDVSAYVEQEYQIGTYKDSEHITFRKKNQPATRRQQIQKSEVKQIDNLLAHKTFCFTGRMQKKRKELVELIFSHGGEITDFITPQTTFVVVGKTKEKDGVMQLSSKQRQVKKLQEQGAQVQVLSEVEFYQLLTEAKIKI